MTPVDKSVNYICHYNLFLPLLGHFHRLLHYARATPTWPAQRPLRRKVTVPAPPGPTWEWRKGLQYSCFPH